MHSQSTLNAQPPPSPPPPARPESWTCFTELSNSNLPTPLSVDRCDGRFRYLVNAKTACLNLDACTGVVDDDGMLCRGVWMPFELRKSFNIEASPGETAWLRSSCDPPSPPLPSPSPVPPPSPSPTAFPAEGVLVLGGMNSAAELCVRDPSATTAPDGRAIAAQCCSGTTCKRTLSGSNYGCIFGDYIHNTPPFEETTWLEASRRCALRGLTLCDQNCAGKGCMYDMTWVWTSLTCPPVPPPPSPPSPPPSSRLYLKPPPSPPPAAYSWAALGASGLTCFEEFEGNLPTPLDDDRCSVRYSTLEMAKTACVRAASCTGVVDDAGIVCSGQIKPFELRRSIDLENASGGETAWLRTSCGPPAPPSDPSPTVIITSVIGTILLVACLVAAWRKPRSLETTQLLGEPEVELKGVDEHGGSAWGRPQDAAQLSPRSRMDNFLHQVRDVYEKVMLEWMGWRQHDDADML